MVVDLPLDYTPDFTFTTVQFKSEALNVIVTSFLAVLILANIGSIVSKLVAFTRHGYFNYDSWLRAFIFAHSDDPVKIFSWLRRRYVFHDPRWPRADHHLRLRRLITPLMARCIVLMASVASVAVTIPGEKVINACAAHDYSLRLNSSLANYTYRAMTACYDIELRSDLGNVRSRASYCQCPSNGEIGLPFQDGTAAVQFSKNEGNGGLYFALVHGNHSFARAMWIEWKDSENTGVRFWSNVDSISIETGVQTAFSAIQWTNPQCKFSSQGFNETAPYKTVVWYLKDCALERPDLTADVIESFMRNALVLKPITGTDRRIKGDLKTEEISSYEGCPLLVIVTRPLMNVVPLLIALFTWFTINVIVSFAIGNSGHSVLDSAFHIIKETLGHDCTSNPLEENKDGCDVKVLRLHKWICRSSGEGHVGYIAQEGDHPVDEFHENVFVGRCARASSEVRNFTGIPGHSAQYNHGINQNSTVGTNPVYQSGGFNTTYPMNVP